MANHKFTNHLIHQTSPYLLQHAHNPVQWHAWSETVLEQAKKEDKPILVSIGYAACHWCHVMERESFENEETAALMNRHFINIKVDREERPDLDHIYMDAVQAISGSGGWPLNVFLLPDGRPFYGGTYYPPVQAFNRMSWTELLTAIHEMFTQKRNEAEAQADNLLYHLSSASHFLQQTASSDENFKEENLNIISDALLKAADIQWGGFGNAPKFPQTFSIQYLLRHYYYTGNENSVKQALLSLDKMIGGGIYDQLGGGFSRYSTDEKWLAPHFEKMLYDNALLITTISEAYQITGKQLYADAIRHTMQFISREMLAPEGGFYSALDADSEGVEGKYYTWQKEEIKTILGEEDGNFFCNLFGITETGNWENTNILWLSHNTDWEKNLLNPQTKNTVTAGRQKLLAARQQRIRPQLDDKIILGWNALMITACCKAFAALGDAAFLTMAENNIAFLHKNLYKDGVWQHSWKEGKCNHTAFLDDYAYLIQAYIQLQEVTGNGNYLLQAKQLSEYVLKHFTDNDSPMFFYTPDYQHDVVIRKTEIYDGATPSGNAVMAICLHHLSLIFDKQEWKFKSQHMLQSIAPAVIKYPTSFGVWAMAYGETVKEINEIIITGDKASDFLHQLQKHFIANKVVQAATTKPENERFILLKNRFQAGQTIIYVCKRGVCKLPVQNVESALALL